MNWKEFLKPDWRKIVIFVILFVMLIIIANLYPPKLIPSWLENLNIIFYFPDFFIFEILKLSISTVIFLFILDLIYWYLLSCLIVWVYDKVKKKK